MKWGELSGLDNVKITTSYRLQHNGHNENMGFISLLFNIW